MFKKKSLTEVMKMMNQTQNWGASPGSKSPNQPLRALRTCLALGVVAALTPALHAATTITTEPSSLGTLFPAVADVIVATPSTAGLFAQGASVSLSQTVQSSGFDLKTIYIQYQDVDGQTFDLNIFTVADVSDGSLLPVSTILTETITLPATTARTVAAIELDLPLTLAANGGTDGYAVHLATADNTMQWLRTGSTAGSVYGGGVAYQDGLIKSSGARDFVMALDSLPVPEPSSAALLGIGFLLMVGRLRSRRSH